MKIINQDGSFIQLFPLQVIAGTEAVEFTMVSGQAISSGKAVVIKGDGRAYVYDISDEDHYGLMCGLAKTAASAAGEDIVVVFSGVAEQPGAGWIAGQRYYISASGTLNTSPPSSGIIRMVGAGVGTDKILLNSSQEYITI